MSRRWLLSLFCLLCLIGALVFAQLTRGAAYVLQVNKSTTTTLLLEEERVFRFCAPNSWSPSIGETRGSDLLAPYAPASYESREYDSAASAATNHKTLAQHESNTTYFELKTTTPLNARGIARRQETAAIMLYVLPRSPSLNPCNQSLTPPQQSAPHDGPLNNVNPALQTNDQLIRSGLLFLLRQKDRYGVWYSTPVTIHCLESLLAMLGRVHRTPKFFSPPPKPMKGDPIHVNQSST